MIVRTSATHPIRVDWLRGSEKIGLTFAPGKHQNSMEGGRWERDLAQDIARLREFYGIQTLVCLLEDERELARLKIPSLEAEVKKAGIDFIHFSICDGWVPESIAKTHELVLRILQEARAGKHVLIHCAGGLGRTGTIAGCVLVQRGHSPEEALTILVEDRKDKRCPENNQQKEFIHQYARAFPATKSTTEVPSVGNALIEGLLSLEGSAISANQHTREQVHQLLKQLETTISKDPACFTFDYQGRGTLSINGKTWHAGSFETPTLGELKARIQAKPKGGGKLRLFVLEGASPLTDIGTLQAFAPAGSLFQVASQFNCLESPGAYLAKIQDYTSDPTQGPRASVSGFPGTFLRHYAAPNKIRGRFVQDDSHQINLLEAALDKKIAEVQSGYLLYSNIHDVKALPEHLAKNFEQIRVGVHDGVQVVFGNNWGGPANTEQKIAQVFTSTLALGYGAGRGEHALLEACGYLLRAAYLGTLLAAIELEKQTVVLTLIGGGVFANPHDLIWESILWAMNEAESLASGPLDVIVNARTPIEASSLKQIQARDGQIIKP